jgi:D-alanyl-D-alanine carboxypeptidase
VHQEAGTVRRLTVALALLIALSGCGQGQRYHQPGPQARAATAVSTVRAVDPRASEDAAEAYHNPLLQRLGQLPPLTPEQAAIAEGVLNGATGRGCGPNGFIKQRCLRAIYRGQLIKRAAQSWNAMNAKAQKPRSKGGCGLVLYPLGSLSSYRNYGGQSLLWNSPPHVHDRNWKAFPGTSNHGLGWAVDLASRAMRTCVDRIGSFFGWAKRCSDAQLEWWHMLFNLACTHGGWTPPARPARRQSAAQRCAHRHTKRSRTRCLRHRAVTAKR